MKQRNAVFVWALVAVVLIFGSVGVNGQNNTSVISIPADGTPQDGSLTDSDNAVIYQINSDVKTKLVYIEVAVSTADANNVTVLARQGEIPTLETFDASETLRLTQGGKTIIRLVKSLGADVSTEDTFVGVFYVNPPPPPPVANNTENGTQPNEGNTIAFTISVWTPTDQQIEATPAGKSVTVTTTANQLQYFHFNISIDQDQTLFVYANASNSNGNDTLTLSIAIGWYPSVGVANYTSTFTKASDKDFKTYAFLNSNQVVAGSYYVMVQSTIDTQFTIIAQTPSSGILEVGQNKSWTVAASSFSEFNLEVGRTSSPLYIQTAIKGNAYLAFQRFATKYDYDYALLQGSDLVIPNQNIQYGIWYLAVYNDDKKDAQISVLASLPGNTQLSANDSSTTQVTVEANAVAFFNIDTKIKDKFIEISAKASKTNKTSTRDHSTENESTFKIYGSATGFATASSYENTSETSDDNTEVLCVSHRNETASNGTLYYITIVNGDNSAQTIELTVSHSDTCPKSSRPSAGKIFVIVLLVAIVLIAVIVTALVLIRRNRKPGSSKVIEGTTNYRLLNNP